MIYQLYKKYWNLKLGFNFFRIKYGSRMIQLTLFSLFGLLFSSLSFAGYNAYYLVTNSSNIVARSNELVKKANEERDEVLAVLNGQKTMVDRKSGNEFFASIRWYPISK